MAGVARHVPAVHGKSRQGSARLGAAWLGMAGMESPSTDGNWQVVRQIHGPQIGYEGK
jgi:hypothetical protein